MGYICEHLQDIICEMEILEKEENNNIDNLISKIKSNYLKRKEVK